MIVFLKAWSPCGPDHTLLTASYVHGAGFFIAGQTSGALNKAWSTSRFFRVWLVNCFQIFLSPSQISSCKNFLILKLTLKWVDLSLRVHVSYILLLLLLYICWFICSLPYFWKDPSCTEFLEGEFLCSCKNFFFAVHDSGRLDFSIFCLSVRRQNGGNDSSKE